MFHNKASAKYKPDTNTENKGQKAIKYIENKQHNNRNRSLLAPTKSCLQETRLTTEDINELKMKAWKKIIVTVTQLSRYTKI